MGTKLLLLNGPPRSGKDTIGRLLKELFPEKVDLFKFSAALKDEVHATHGLDVKHDHFDNCKDEPCEEFMGNTPRQEYIYFSEKLAKPKYGQGYFGTLLGEEIFKQYRRGTSWNWIVVTDSGFKAEARALGNVLAPERTIVAEIHRPRCDFRNDSRSHWWTPSLAEEDSARGEYWYDQPEHVTWVNSGPLERLKDRVITWANRIGLS